MSLRILLAGAVALATPVTTLAAVQTAAEVKAPVPAKTKPAVDPAQMMAGMMKVFDRIFPAGPEPEPARLAAARTATAAMLPKGAYAEAMNGFMDRTVTQVLSMSEADFLAMMPPPKPKKGEKPKVPSTEPLRVSLTRKDPTFDAKLEGGKAFAKVMFTKFADVAEPRMREGMARSLARKFDAKQLGEIQAFLATPTGAAYGRQMVGLWFEPDVMRESFKAFPDMMKLMPDAMKDAAALDPKAKAAGEKAQ